MGLLQFVSYLTIYINQAGCRGQSRLPWIRCIVPSKYPECGCLFCWVAEGFAVGNRWLSIWLGWGKTGRFKGQAALPLSVQNGDFVPLPTPSTPLAVLCDVHSGVRGSPSYNPQSRKEPSLRFTGWFGLPIELACLPRNFSFLWAAGTESRWWSISVSWCFQPIGGCRVHRDTHCNMSPLLSELVLWTSGESDMAANCIILGISVNCLISVLLQFASRTFWGWLRFQWACANFISVGHALYCWAQDWKFIWRVMFWG